MNESQKKLKIYLLAFLSASALSGKLLAQDQKESKKVAYINHDKLVLEEDEKITKFYTPKELLEHGRFQVRIKRPKAKVIEEENPTPKVATIDEKIEARRLMHEANQAYFKGEISKAWDLVAQAEKLEPDFYRIKTMKGSLLYKIGSVDLAKELWIQSLAQNPNQPEIEKMISQMGSSTPVVAPIAKQSDQTNNTKGVVQ